MIRCLDASSLRPGGCQALACIQIQRQFTISRGSLWRSSAFSALSEPPSSPPTSRPNVPSEKVQVGEPDVPSSQKLLQLAPGTTGGQSRSRQTATAHQNVSASLLERLTLRFRPHHTSAAPAAHVGRRRCFHVRNKWLLCESVVDVGQKFAESVSQFRQRTES